MITLYELHWSHYCEKVRLALNYMGVSWRRVNINAFGKEELRRYPLPEHLPNYMVPAIYDELADRLVMDSTPILRYLADHYPDSPSLFPGTAAERNAIEAKLIELDTFLGLPARRFAYTQVILECPDALTDLFLAELWGGVFCKSPLRWLAGHALGLMLCKRFAFHQSEKLGLYEAVEKYLLDLTCELDTQEFVAGRHFSAADLALAAQLRPLTVVPFFAENPRLQGLFRRHRTVLAQCGSEQRLRYQEAIEEARKRRAPFRRRARSPAPLPVWNSRRGFAANDQQTVWDWRILLMPYHYLVSLRLGKLRQALASADVR